MQEVVVTIRKDWLQGMLSQMLDCKQEEVNAAVVNRGSINILSVKREGRVLVPSFSADAPAPSPAELEPPPAEAADETIEEKAEAAGLTPIYRDADGLFCAAPEDVDGKPEFFLENLSDENLKTVADSLGIVRPAGSTREDVIAEIRHGFKIEGE